MNYTLVHHTEDWSTEGVYELPSIPQAGSLIMIEDDEALDMFGSPMYYVDNVMLTADSDECYLFVTPFKGWGRFSPRSINETLVERMEQVSERIERIEAGMGRLFAQNTEQLSKLQVAVQRQLNGLCNDTAEINASLTELSEEIKSSEC